MKHVWANVKKPVNWLVLVTVLVRVVALLPVPTVGVLVAVIAAVDVKILVYQDARVRVKVAAKVIV